MAAAAVIPGIHRRQEPFERGAVRRGREHGQDALPCFQRAVEIVPWRSVGNAGVHLPRTVIEQHHRRPQKTDRTDPMDGRQTGCQANANCQTAAYLLPTLPR